MAERLDTIIFDADGTILDTREFIYQAFEQTFSEHGHAVPTRETLFEHMGKPLAEMYEIFARELEADVEKMIAHHKELHRGVLMPLVAAYEGLHELFAQLRARGMHIAVCTNRDGHAKTLFSQIGMLEEIEVFITTDDVVVPKPDPEGINKILQQLGTAPENAVMVGDTDADIGAGKNAGVAITIGVTHGFGTEKILREAGADFVVDHLDKILPIIDTHK